MAAASVLRHPVRTPIIVIVALGAAVWTGRFLYHYWRYESTDDAYVTGHVHEVSSEVDGRVAAVFAHENEAVTAGQPLVKLDPLEFDLGVKKAAAAVAQAEAAASESQAAIQQAEAGFGQAKAKAAQAEAQIAQARAQAVLAEANLRRAEQLGSGEDRAVTPADLDSAGAAAAAAKAAVTAADANAAAARAEVNAATAEQAAARGRVRAAQAAIELAQAAQRDAERKQGYVTVKAPAAGIVGAKNVEPGNRVQTGQTLMVVVEPQVWLEANFKETQLAHLRLGQAVDVAVDAIPGHEFHGKVESFAPATGAQFALLPADNATGNFTKVVQRVPVRISLAPESLKGFEDRLRPGLSANADVDVK